MKRVMLGRLMFGVMVAALVVGQLPVRAQGGPSPAQGSVPPAPTPLPPVRSDDPWFGAVQAIAAPQAALNAGVKWQRLIFPWDQIQPNNSTEFQQGYFSDADIDAQLALGLEITGVTLYTPRWAARDPSYGGRSVPANLGRPIDDPRNYWAAYVKQLVGHYRGRINNWVFYNEPDMYRDPNDYHTFAGTPEDYAQVLKTAYLAAKSVNPDAKVIMAGFTYSWDKEAGRPQYLQRVLDAIGGDPNAARYNWYFDVVDAHTYGNPLNTFAVPTVFRRILRDKGLDKPIWITESNVLVQNDPRVAAGEGPFRGTLDDQASYVIQAMALARAAGVQRFSMYKMQDEAPENGDEYWGLTRNDGTVRPEYLAYQVAARYFQNVRGAIYYWWGSQIPPSEQEVTALLASNTNRFQWPWPAPVNVVVLDRGTERVTVIWNGASLPATVALPAQSRSARIVDKYGREQPLVATNGYYPLNLEPSRNNSDPRDPTAYLVGGSPWLIVEDMTQAVTPAPTFTPTPGPSPTPHATFLPTPGASGAPRP
ncbi:MAG TPA: glycosyl hydrolase [Chloroflexota bacterium]|jgi:hypothetical protein